MYRDGPQEFHLVHLVPVGQLPNTGTTLWRRLSQMFQCDVKSMCGYNSDQNSQFR